MNKKKKVTLFILLTLVLLLGSVQLVLAKSATFSNWFVFRVPPSQSVVVNHGDPANINNFARGTTQALDIRATGRRAMVESRNQTMWTTPQVRFTSNIASPTEWIGASNNDITLITIPFAANIVYTLNVRANSLQLNSNTAEFRFCLNGAVFN